MLDFLHSGFSLIARSLAQFEKSIFVPDFLHSDLPPPLQQFVRADLFLAVLGTSALGSLSFLPVADTCSTGLSLSPHASSQVGFFMLAPSLCLEPSLFLHSLVRLDASSSHSGIADYGAFRTLFVVGFVSLGFSFLLRSFAYMNSAAPVLSFSHSEALLLSRALAQLDLPLLSPGPSCKASFVPVLGAHVMDSLVFPQGLACLALLLPVLTFNAMELPSLVRNLVWPGFSLPSARSKVSTSVVFDSALLESLLPARTSVCLDSFLSMFSSINLGLLSSLQSFCRTELPVPPLGLQRLGPVFAVPVIDSAIPGPALPSHSLVQLELLMFPTNTASLDALLTLHGICWTGTVSSPGFGRSGFPLLVPSSSHIEVSILLKGRAHLGSLILVLNSVLSELVLPLQSFCEVDAVTPALSSVSLDLSSLISDSAYLGFSLSLRSTCQPGFHLSICKLSSLDLSLPVPGISHTGSGAFLRGVSCTDLLLFVSCAHLGLLSTSQSVL